MQSCQGLSRSGTYLLRVFLGHAGRPLLEAAGFKFSRLIETRGVFSLVEALPAPIPNLKAGSEGEDSQDVHINLKHKYLKDYGVINVDLEPEP